MVSHQLDSLELHFEYIFIFIFYFIERSNKYKTSSSSQQNFSGLRSTSKKDRELGKKEFSLPKKSSNALRRIQSKQNKQTANKHNRNKQRNMQRKVNKPKK